MSTPPIPNDINDALALYFDNQATPEVCKAIEDWLEENPANAHIFAEFGYVERMVYTAQKTEDASAVFAMLAEMEQAADAEIVELKLDAGRPSKQDDPGPLSMHDLASVGGYVLRKFFTNKKVITTGICSAAAAVLLLALILINPFASDDPTPIADQGFSEDTDTPKLLTPAVATLTASHHAQWGNTPAERALARGSELHPGTRLTLTAGFAEITTQRGAVAILEAPCTVQMIDSPNALRLHAGKMVGICETQSSKGFMVRTPYMDVTDLGTRFGVSASEQAATVRVFQGSVHLDQPGATSEPLLLLAGQGAEVDRQGEKSLQSNEQAGDQFARLMHRIDLNQLKISGSVRLLSAPPASVERGQAIDRQNLQLLREQSGILLTSQTPIDITGAGEFSSTQYTAEPVTLQGKRVTSYLLFASQPNPTKLATEGDVTQLSASITFDGEIVGLIGKAESLQQTDAILGLNHVVYGTHKARGMLTEGRAEIHAAIEDMIEISEDRRTLTVDCRFAGMDQMRILVESPATTGGEH